jgi:methionyl-tRNA synthetase
MQKTKAKVQYAEANLAALAIANVARAISSEVPVTKSGKPAVEGRSDIFNVELKVDQSVFYGELTIISYLVGLKNAEMSSGTQYLTQGSSDLKFDNLIFMLNSKLRKASDAFAITCKNSEPAKDTIKQIAKELEESNVFQELAEGPDASRKVVAAAMVFSFLDPV